MRALSIPLAVVWYGSSYKILHTTKSNDLCIQKKYTYIYKYEYTSIRN